MEKLYRLPKFEVKPYRTKIGSATLSYLFEGYEDIGLRIAPELYSFDRSKAIGYLLKDSILVLFHIIDNGWVFRESSIETFAKIGMVSRKRFTVFLQKSLFETAYENLIAIIQLKLDEILLISQGYSLKKAHESAMQSYRNDSSKSIIERRIKYPGKETLKRLIKKHRGNVRKISEDPEINGVLKSTVSIWINEDLELQNLAAQERMKKHIKVTSKTTKPSPRKGRKKTRKLPSNPGKEMLEALIINYEGDLRAMTENLNIETDLKTLQSWIDEERLYEFVEQQKRGTKHDK